MVTYAPATENDIPRIMELQEECGLSYWSEEAYREAVEATEKRLYIARDSHNAVGFLLARLITREFLTEILNICVASNFRRRQIGVGLLTFLTDSLSNDITKLWLEVREGNLIAIAFYEKQGFQKVGVRKNFYRNPEENAILMQKDL